MNMAESERTGLAHTHTTNTLWLHAFRRSGAAFLLEQHGQAPQPRPANRGAAAWHVAD